jgi:hypothetical protein
MLKRLLRALDEGQKRWFVGREAMLLGRGGIRRMCQASGLSKPTVLRGIRELRGRKALRPGQRVRHVGGGRKAVEARDPAILSDLARLMEETTAGDPMSLLKWSQKSTYQLQKDLGRLGHRVSEDTVQRLLKEMGYSLQSNRKDKEGRSSPQRDQQFRHLNRLSRQYVACGDPVISVDTKKKERVGCFKNPGQHWRPQGRPQRVNIYDYPSLAEGTAIPYGAYDRQRNQGMVNVGRSHDTPEFAVESIRRWWRKLGRWHYPKAKRLLICADCGGSNGARNRAWKYHLQELADQIGLEISVCHYPPGTSKWNQIEHRMFSFISINWRGQPLTSYETVVSCIRGTHTQTGLQVKALLDKGEYEAGEKISPDEMAKLKLVPSRQNPQWNYTFLPRTVAG